MALIVPCVAIRGSTGISISQGPPTYEPVSAFIKDDSKHCKAMAFSPMGHYFAWANAATIKVVSCETWQVIAEIEKPKVQALAFSPQDTYLMTWEPFVVSTEKPQGSPNLHFWDPKTGKLERSFIQKKQTDWEPQWSSDEKICGMLVNNDVVLYEQANFDVILHRINVAKISKFSISPSAAPYHIFCCMPGKSGQPSIGKLFEYPKFQANQQIAFRSFYQDDRIEFYWNKPGTSLLLLTSSDVDKTGASYYGKQTLHFINTKGHTALVTMSKDGPIHSLQWSPKATEFIVVYGFMPSKASLFNLKCEPIFEFGTKHRNAVYYNPHGNIAILTGFGNLRGDVELWDIANKKVIATSDAPDTTMFEWSPDGEHYVTATTAPRLRMSNGFKIWHYTGTLLYERPWNKQEELWHVTWQKYPPNTFNEKPISYKAVEGIAPSQPQASKQAYRPPSARGKPASTFKLHDDEDEVKPPESNPSKNALKVKKKREAKKAKKEQEASLSQAQGATSNGQVSSSSKISSPTAATTNYNTNDPEKNKKIKKIKSKLDAIAKLKESQAAGKQLEINQLDKIKKETELFKELEELII